MKEKWRFDGRWHGAYLRWTCVGGIRKGQTLLWSARSFYGGVTTGTSYWPKMYRTHYGSAVANALDLRQ